MRLKGVILDMDGTVVDAPYDWTQIKADLDTGGKPILSFIRELKEPEQSQKWKILERYEKKASRRARLKEGMGDFLNFLTKKKIKKALVTNNSAKNVSYLLRKFKLEFDCVISRERGLWKPSGAPFLAALDELNLKQDECCVVGDSQFDVKAAGEAGIPVVFVLNNNKELFASAQAEVFTSVDALKRRIALLLKT